jgi:hypothetical protein
MKVKGRIFRKTQVLLSIDNQIQKMTLEPLSPFLHARLHSGQFAILTIAGRLLKHVLHMTRQKHTSKTIVLLFPHELP